MGTPTRHTPPPNPYPTEHHCTIRERYVLPLSLTHSHPSSLPHILIVGVYTTAPLWGRLTDSRGPRLPLGAAALLSLTGYSGIRHLFLLGAPPLGLPHPTFALLILFAYMNGAASIACVISTTNATAKSFPDTAVRVMYFIGIS